jgi:peptide/nickel transport system permease protein
MAYITRMTRSFTLEQLNQDYVIAARAKGVRPMRTLTGHILPNIAVQLITVLAISYGGLLEGAVVTEIVFLLARYRPVHDQRADDRRHERRLAGTIIIGFVFMLLNFLADVAYALLDPRTREATI